jgi:hypothetical protein
MKSLKDFQRATVNYVYHRLYQDANPARRFLIADEVGLGKTMIARGVLARVLERRRRAGKHLRVLYICSNADIARQNIVRINPGQAGETADSASRLTLLAEHSGFRSGREIDFFAFTPDTSFDPGSSRGRKEERILLHYLLKRFWHLKGRAPLEVLRAAAGFEGFEAAASDYERREQKLHGPIIGAFKKELDRGLNLRSRFEQLCQAIGSGDRAPSGKLAEDCSKLIRELRSLLAEVSVQYLRPDLIIMDEFQRFRELLSRDESETSRLAQQLINYSEGEDQARVILLSATPYKMYTLFDETVLQSEDHQEDFVTTLDFLFCHDAKKIETIRALLRRFRMHLTDSSDGDTSSLLAIKKELEACLRQVMVRTERLSVTENRDGMLRQIPSPPAGVNASEVNVYLSLQDIAREIGHPDVLEYWKSAPYLLNFMDDYLLKKKFIRGCDGNQASKIAEALHSSPNALLDWDIVRRYGKVDPANARLRSLWMDVIEPEAWKLLWIPPSLPYYQASGPFSAPSLQQFTKRLVFSGWRVVPKAVATLLSYEAERRMTQLFDDSAVNTPEARRRRGDLLSFGASSGRLAGMPLFLLLYPSAALAEIADPLQMAALGANGKSVPTLDEVAAIAETRIRKSLERLPEWKTAQGRTDDAWFWVAPLLLDRADGKDPNHWLARNQVMNQWALEGADREMNEESKSAWKQHVERAYRTLNEKVVFGRPPEELPGVLAKAALAAPGVVALRALGRLVADKSGNEMRDAAARIAWAFFSLFNLPESASLLRGLDHREPYWECILHYAAAGGLQSVLDEYVHQLNESVGFGFQNSNRRVQELSRQISEVIRLRTVAMDVDVLSVGQHSISRKDASLRCRFALPFADIGGDGNQAAVRRSLVRQAFNSPFWPFVLTSTSVGQEGLDFHSYCHAVVHWNLPSNPVDLEQREGRVHRYKGHAVRKNLATRFGVPEVEKGDPWEVLFEKGRSDQRGNGNDLVPYWVFAIPGGAYIERHVPMLPLSRDAMQLAALRRSLAAYRLVFGQARQEELLDYLLSTYPDQTKLSELVTQLRMDLSPEVSHPSAKSKDA